jgi:anti-sigma factor RsiW
MSDLLDAYLADALDEPRRNVLRSHLRACERCREAAVHADPSLLIVAAPPSAPDPGRVEDVTRAVVAQIRQQRLQRRLVHRHYTRPAVVLALMVAGWRLLALRRPDPPRRRCRWRAPSPPPVEVDMAGEGVRVFQCADQQDGDTAVTFIVNQLGSRPWPSPLWR